MVLPAPLGPMRAESRRGSKRRLTSSSTTWPPKALRRPRVSRMGAVPAVTTLDVTRALRGRFGGARVVEAGRAAHALDEAQDALGHEEDDAP